MESTNTYDLIPLSLAPHGALTSCLSAIRMGDFLAAPVSALWIERSQEAHLAVRDGSALGVCWRREMGGWSAIGVSVIPKHRRRGVGRALLRRLLRQERRAYASFDPTSVAARRLLEREGFQPRQLCTLRRWDGEVEEVAPAFHSATLRASVDAERLTALIRAFDPQAWPPPWVDQEDIQAGRAWARIAARGGEDVGAVIIYPLRDAWEVGALAVRPDQRGSGVGRLLLVEAMRAAATAGCGLALRVSEDQDALDSLTLKLGFWSFRIWAHYALDLTHSEDK